jgi:hypothetical protein
MHQDVTILHYTYLTWNDNIKMDLREIGLDGANWIHLAQDRIQWRACMNTLINLRVP